MTVKELKEILELIIEDGKGDYTAYVNVHCNEYQFSVDDEKKEVYL